LIGSHTDAALAGEDPEDGAAGLGRVGSAIVFTDTFVSAPPRRTPIRIVPTGRVDPQLVELLLKVEEAERMWADAISSGEGAGGGAEREAFERFWAASFYYAAAEVTAYIYELHEADRRFWAARKNVKEV
jgi:hypothetical protein